jgi:sulfate transport system permease protein
VRRYVLRFLALGYLLAVLLGPLSMVFFRAFDKGVDPLWKTLSDPNTVHAFKLTLIIALIAVPLNAIFGVVCALAIVRRRFPGAGIVNAIVDLPLAISPVVVGLSLFLLYGRTGWFGPWFARHGMQILFALPSIRWAVIYGVVLTTARCLGEYGAVAVVSGNIEGKTQTATLRVQDAYENFNQSGAYGISLVLAAISVIVLVTMTLLRPKEEEAL